MIKHAAGFIVSAIFVLFAVVGSSTGAEVAKGTSQQAAPAANDARSVTVATKRRQLIERVVEELTAEAIDVGKYKDATISPHFGRPHPTLGGFGPDAALDVLDRMLQPFAGNVYEDTYVRWHLMHVVNLASESDRKQMGRRFVQLIKQMPETLGISQRSEFRREPEDVATDFFRIRDQLRVTIGYPPYQRRYDPPESFEYMSVKRRAEAEVLWEKAKKMQDRFSVIVDVDALAFNGRIREVNWIVRQYRGELIYALFFTGDQGMVELIISTINGHARKRSGIAFDLLAFGYLAVFDGALDLYEPSFLKQMGKNLMRAAKANEEWTDYKGRKRNFADYAFHMISLLEDGGGFTQQQPTTAVSPQPDADHAN